MLFHTCLSCGTDDEQRIASCELVQPGCVQKDLRMLFLPYTFDLSLKKIPFLTIIIMLACLFIYLHQYINTQIYIEKTEEFCSIERSSSERMIMKKTLGDTSSTSCLKLMRELSLSEEPQELIEEYSLNSEKFVGLSEKDSQYYIRSYLMDEYRSYRDNVPPLATKNLWYVPESWNPVTMVTSSFSHGSWEHLIGNMLFFYIFAAAVELIIGSFAFISVVLAMAFGTSISYSLVMMQVENALPTVGISGIVMGMIAMLAYFMPTSKIRCFYWFLLKIGTFAISTWIVALFFIGVDVYTLLTQEEMGSVNLVAHVSGAVMGFLLAFLFFRKHKRNISIGFM